MAERTASCACGQLKVTVEGDPDFVAMCHCTDCQKRTGSPFGSGAFYPRTRVTMTGNYRNFSRRGDSGSTIKNYFCPECGTSIAWESEGQSGVLGVAVGSFTDPSFPAPMVSVYTSNKYHWLPLPEGMRILERGRPPAKS
jgi:hypothetical protein